MSAAYTRAASSPKRASLLESVTGCRKSDMVECVCCGHFVAPHAPLCAACGTRRSGILDERCAAPQLVAHRPVRQGRAPSLRTKIACIFIFSVAVATFSWQQRYGGFPASLDVGAQFAGEAGSYFIGSLPFAIIPRSAGLVAGLGVLLFRALVV